MNNELFKKFDYYWLYFIFTIVLCFGFYLTRSSMGITLHACNFMAFMNFDNFVFDKKMAVIFAYTCCFFSVQIFV